MKADILAAICAQSTWCPSNSGPSTHTKRVFPPTLTRHPPHIPVPSIITVFSDTVVFTPNGSVVRQQNFIITGGPIAMTSSTPPARHSSSSGSVTRPLRPLEPSSVIFIRFSPAMARISSSITKRLSVRAPIITVTLLPAAFSACAMGCSGATPMPPPTHTTCPGFSPFSPRISVGRPSGPSTAATAPPSSRAASFAVVAPTVWNTSVTVPAAASASPIVSGMRSPSSASAITITNCPALRARATRGASTVIRQTLSESIVFDIILFIRGPPCRLPASVSAPRTPARTGTGLSP